MADTDLARDDARQLDELRLGRAVSVGLPVATLGGAAVAGVTSGPAMGVLVVAAGLLLGVIALFWTSLRILSGDVSLPPELEALDAPARGVDALATRKTMLLRALKDLENEHALGKIEDEDFEQMAQAHRSELKAVLKRIDETLAPHREKAEALATEHLRKAGLGSADAAPREETKPTASTEARATPREDAPRIPCPKCGDSNEAGAKFCKECATRLEPATDRTKATSDDA